MTQLLSISTCLIALTANLAWADSASPYAGQETRDIKALAPADVEAYLSGEGMGLAKAAELNGYPGPAHILAMATALDLSPNQKQRTEAIFNSMKAKATAFGHDLVEQERELDKRFAAKTITDESLDVILRRIGELQAKVRETHLQAHLAQLAILTPSQVAKYQELRFERGRVLTLDGPSLRTKHLGLDDPTSSEALHQPARISGIEAAEFPEPTPTADDDSKGKLRECPWTDPDRRRSYRRRNKSPAARDYFVTAGWRPPATLLDSKQTVRGSFRAFGSGSGRAPSFGHAPRRHQIGRS